MNKKYIEEEINFHTQKTRKLIKNLTDRGGRFVSFKCEKDVLEKLEGIRLDLGLSNRQQVLEFLVLSYETPKRYLGTLYDHE